MCQTGGPRCYTEAKKSADKAEAAWQEADARVAALHEQHSREGDNVTDNAWRAATEARQVAAGRLRDAYADLSASPKGLAELRTRMESTGPDGLRTEGMHQVFAEGEFRRERGQIARTIRDRHHNDALFGILGKSGDTHADALAEQAARNMAISPDDYPGWTHTLPGPRDGEPVGTGMMEAWRYAVTSKAAEVDKLQRRAGQAAMEVTMTADTVKSNPNDLAARARLAQAQTELTRQDKDLRLAQADLAMTAVKCGRAERIHQDEPPMRRRMAAVNEVLTGQ